MRPDACDGTCALSHRLQALRAGLEGLVALIGAHPPVLEELAALLHAPHQLSAQPGLHAVHGPGS